MTSVAKFTVMVVGSNPSRSQPNPKLPFFGSRSLAILLYWLEALGCQHAHLTNVSDQVTPENRPLKVSEYQLDRLKAEIDRENPTAIITVGKTADHALKKLGVDHYPLPHPSGRNRLLNDPDYVRERLEECQYWLTLARARKSA